MRTFIGLKLSRILASVKTYGQLRREGKDHRSILRNYIKTNRGYISNEFGIEFLKYAIREFGLEDNTGINNI